MPQTPSDADQFSDDEMEQMKRYGAAQLGGTQFSDAVEKELNKLQKKREASAAKMKAAQTGGAGLGPTDAEQAAVKQEGALQQQAATAGGQAAAQAQGAQAGASGPPTVPPLAPKAPPPAAAAQAPVPPPPAPGPEEQPPEEEAPEQA